MRLAWFSPLPPVRSGIATYSAELLPRLAECHEIDCYVDRSGDRVAGNLQSVARTGGCGRVFDAHDFLWRQRRNPYDLVVYHLGNAPCHDYMWAYLASYPGLVVLHDARLHHARARSLLNQHRFDDYRHEFWFDHPGAVRDFVEYAVEGLGGPIYYFWSMLGVVMRSARSVAVHNPRVAADLREEFAGASVDTIRMGVPDSSASDEERQRVRGTLGVAARAVVFAALGKVTAEKRTDAILRALGALVTEGIDAHLLLVGDSSEHRTLAGDIERHGITNRVHSTGYVGDETLSGYLAAADACLCLRWPTAQETSASWLRCLAAAKPTVTTALAHLADVPALDPRNWHPMHPAHAGAAMTIAIDLLDEDHSLRSAMRRLATDAHMGAHLARAGREYWSTNHTLDLMAADYLRVMDEAAGRPAQPTSDLPAHFTKDYTEPARLVACEFGVDVDILE
jgi:glycosyltransferase involved in cell wall biosynthesis